MGRQDLDNSPKQSANADLANLKGPSIDRGQDLGGLSGPSLDSNQEVSGRIMAQRGMLQVEAKTLRENYRKLENAQKQGQLSGPQAELLRLAKGQLPQVASAVRFMQTRVDDPSMEVTPGDTAKAAQTLVKLQKLNSKMKKFV